MLSWNRIEHILPNFVVFDESFIQLMYIIIPGPMKTQIFQLYHVLDCNNGIVGGDRTRH